MNTARTEQTLKSITSSAARSTLMRPGSDTLASTINAGSLLSMGHVPVALVLGSEHGRTWSKCRAHEENLMISMIDASS